MEKYEQTNTRGKRSAGDEESVLEQTKRRAQAIPDQSNVEAMVIFFTDEVLESFGGADRLLSSLESLMKRLRNVPGERIQ